MDHPTLHKGDLCPECARGKVYELAMPSVFVQIVGQAPLKATVYERARLRCNLCGEIFTPELPEGIKDQKFRRLGDGHAGALEIRLRHASLPAGKPSEEPGQSAAGFHPMGYPECRGRVPLAGL